MNEVSETEVTAGWPVTFASGTNIYALLGGYARFTNQCIENGEWMSVKNCFDCIMCYYTKADRLIRGLVETIYVYALRVDASAELFRQCRTLMPPGLELIYNKLHYNDHP